MGKILSVQRGRIPVLVGEGKEMERVVVHMEELHHPCFLVLLELAAMEFGHHQEGVLRIPCSVECFQATVELIRGSMLIRNVNGSSRNGPFRILGCF
ncbi:auxin-responsive protein SAUR71-like [Oryza brachyantha]|uniref:Auxin responsive protein n=1 Tax=Oryza brachyantha TaxID=4533 RepID=J3LTD4_ORYBR|nr:auxin-responsive protein SAUR71-like [Oryza brachyantha]